MELLQWACCWPGLTTASRFSGTDFAQSSKVAQNVSSFLIKPNAQPKPNQKVIVYQIPSTQLQYVYPTKHDKTDLNQKIVRIDFSQGRPLKQDDQLGPHVRVLSKAA